MSQPVEAKFSLLNALFRFLKDMSSELANSVKEMQDNGYVIEKADHSKDNKRVRIAVSNNGHRIMMYIKDVDEGGMDVMIQDGEGKHPMVTKHDVRDLMKVAEEVREKWWPEDVDSIEDVYDNQGNDNSNIILDDEDAVEESKRIQIRLRKVTASSGDLINVERVFSNMHTPIESTIREVMSDDEFIASLPEVADVQIVDDGDDWDVNIVDEPLSEDEYLKSGISEIILCLFSVRSALEREIWSYSSDDASEELAVKQALLYSATYQIDFWGKLYQKLYSEAPEVYPGTAPASVEGATDSESLLKFLASQYIAFYCNFAALDCANEVLPFIDSILYEISAVTGENYQTDSDNSQDLVEVPETDSDLHDDPSDH